MKDYWIPIAALVITSLPSIVLINRIVISGNSSSILFDEDSNHWGTEWSLELKYNNWILFFEVEYIKLIIGTRKTLKITK